MSGPPDEFDWIARLRPLTGGAPAALDLMDDAAVIPQRPGYDLVISKDAMVEGVHFLPGEPGDVIARRLLRTSLSDLAAKGAEPYGYFLLTAWPPEGGWALREAFVRGLAEDGARFGVVLLGGDTVSTPGPLTVAATVLGWVPHGRMVRRSGAQAGDALVVLGAIGDGGLGLRAARGEIDDPGGVLAGRYRLPEPLFGLGAALLEDAMACADVSDGLLADALHVAEASGCGVTIDLGLAPLSRAGQAWLDAKPDRRAALVELASAGDDYALVCAAQDPAPLLRAAAAQGVPAAVAGSFVAGSGIAVTLDGAPVEARRLGWRHG